MWPLILVWIASAGSVRTDPFRFHASHVDHGKVVNAQKEKLNDNVGDLFSMDYTPPREKPPIHN